MAAKKKRDSRVSMLVHPEVRDRVRRIATLLSAIQGEAVTMHSVIDLATREMLAALEEPTDIPETPDQSPESFDFAAAESDLPPEVRAAPPRPEGSMQLHSLSPEDSQAARLAARRAAQERADLHDRG